jgi:hypothetical protein
MPLTQTRRGFLSVTALASAAGLISPRRGWADEPALETTTGPVQQGAGHLFCPAIYLRGVAPRRGVH